MKRTILLRVAALVVALSTAMLAQIADPRLERLARAVGLIERVNALPVNFRASMSGGAITEQIAADGLADLRRIAALLDEPTAGGRCSTRQAK